MDVAVFTGAIATYPKVSFPCQNLPCNLIKVYICNFRCYLFQSSLPTRCQCLRTWCKGIGQKDRRCPSDGDSEWELVWLQTGNKGSALVRVERRGRLTSGLRKPSMGPFQKLRGKYLKSWKLIPFSVLGRDILKNTCKRFFYLGGTQSFKWFLFLTYKFPDYKLYAFNLYPKIDYSDQLQ